MIEHTGGVLKEKTGIDEAAKAYSLHAFMRPTRDVGGDLYDSFMIDPEHLVH